jgi:flagellar hook-associated protein 3 FlgL
MVTFGIPISGLFTRLSSLEPGNMILANLQNTEQSILQLQEELSTGFTLNKPSDNPVGASVVMNMQTATAQNNAFLNNIQTIQSQLQTADGSLQGANGDITTALQIESQQVSAPSDASSRAQAALQVEQLLEDAVRQANARFANTPLFAGTQTQQDPFSIVNGNVVFTGNVNALNADVSDGVQFLGNVSANAFGAMSDGIQGQNPATQLPIDLNPAVTLNTSLGDLNGGSGVTLGSIQITGTGTATVDLTTAKTLGDVINLINNPKVTAVTGVTASVNAAQNGLALTSGGPITVQEVSNGKTAQDLGIRVTGAASPVAGADLNPRLTPSTPLSALFGGTGIDPSGLVLTNTTGQQSYTATLGPSVFAAGNTVQDVLNAIDGSSAFVTAQINPQGTGIDVSNRLSGGRLKISENGGTTAQELGLLSTLSRARLSDVNAGDGLGTISGPDLVITKKDGTQVQFDLDNMTTVQDFIKAVNASGLTASVTPTDQIQITDPNPAAGTLTIANVGGSFAASSLGIATSASGAGPTTITGTPLSFVGVENQGVFTGLIRLRDALNANDVSAMEASTTVLNAAQTKLLNGRSDLGSRVQSLTMTQNRLTNENTLIQQVISQNRDANLAQVATDFQTEQNVLQAALAASARVLQTDLFSFLSTSL